MTGNRNDPSLHPDHSNNLPQNRQAILNAVKEALEAGLCVVPPKQDGSKRPYTGTWDKYQDAPPTREELRAWYKDGNLTGIGYICGKVSGNLETLDFDDKAVYHAYKEAGEKAGLSDLIEKVEEGYLEDTPKGNHLPYRCDQIAGNTKLAKRPKLPEEKKDENDKTKTLIETKGEGGYIIAAPTFGSVNPAGSYKLLRGSVKTIAKITPEERALLHDLARAFDQPEHFKKDAERFNEQAIQAGGRPGDAFNLRAMWQEVLEPHGWQFVFERKGISYWRRPGKKFGISATTNYANSDLFICFSTSTPFESERGYTKFSAYTVLNHGGDFSAAARELAAKGYGDPIPKDIDQARSQPYYPYFVNDDGYLCRWKEKNNTQTCIRLANFNAKIVEEICEDNGVEQTHRFLVEGRTKERTLPRVSVTTSQFLSMNWVCGAWGNQAILEAGQNTKDLVRHAIQVQSTDAEKKRIFVHTGWRELNNKWVYLTGSGAIGGEDIFVKLPPTLHRYQVPLLPENENQAIRTSLSFLDIGNHRVTFPLHAFLWLSPLTTLLDPMPNFSAYSYGDTGTFKTTVAMLLLSHFGDFSQIGDLSNFDDTANAIEKKAFCLKDTLLVLDDYYPSNRRQDAQQKEQLAQRLIREFSNRTARDRLNPDTSDKGRYTPRGMLLITGEELVQLQSTLARIMVVEFLKGDIHKNELSELQSKAGQLPHAMTSYVLWIRENIEDIRKEFPARFRDLRERASRNDTHLKLPEQVAFLQFGLESMLSWVVDKKVLNESKAKELSQEGWEIFNALSMNQSQRIEDDEPIKKFIDIVQTLLNQGMVRLEQKDGEGVIGGNGNADLIGYYDDGYQYLLPTPLWHVVQKYCVAEQAHFPLSKETLYRRLANKGLIQTDNGRHTVPVRIKGEVKRVLKFIGRSISQNEVTEVTQEETLCTTTAYV